jgi:SNF2 family DNA or RNA helicase
VLEPPLSLEFPDTLDLPSPLYPYQLDGARFLATHEAALLGDDMGTGKTVQTIVALRLLFQSGQARSACIVCPRSVLDTWQTHLEQWSPGLTAMVCHGPLLPRTQAWTRKAHIYLTTYDILRQDTQTIDAWHPAGTREAAARDGQSAVHFDVVVLDECQKIKNPSAQVTAAAKALRARWRWGLSGTPLENSLGDLQSIFGFLLPTAKVLPSTIDLSPADARARIAPYFLRRRKADVLKDLPPKTVVEEWIALGEHQQEAYDEAFHRGRVYLEGLGEHCTIQHVLTLLLRLKEICNRDPETGESTKVEWLRDSVEQMTSRGDKCLVFSQFLGCGIDLIASDLCDWHPLRYTGQTSERQRREALAQFASESGPPLLLLTLKAGGLGLNLTAANYVVLFDHWWNPATMHQAADRVHRVGQQKPVFVYQLWVRDTVEDRIHDILARKQRLYDDVVDSLAADGTQLLTEQELFGLFGLKPPRSLRATAAASALRSLSPPEFERRVGDVWHCLGYAVRVIGGPHDTGVDVVATRNTVGGVEKVAIQCKHTGMVGVDAARSLLGALTSDRSYTKGVLVTSGRFSDECASFVGRHGTLEIVDGPRLSALVAEYDIATGDGTDPPTQSGS